MARSLGSRLKALLNGAHNRPMRVLVVEDDEGIAARPALAPAPGRLGRGHRAERVGGLGRAVCRALRDGAARPGPGRRRRRCRCCDACARAPAGALPDAATPVVIMTARDQVASRIAGLDTRRRRLRDQTLRRRRAGRPHARAAPALRRARPGPAVLGRVWRSTRRPAACGAAAQPVELSAREFGVLLTLMEVRPRVLSRAQIETSLYGWDQLLDSNAIEVHVHHLRRKLGDGVIRTLRGVGYFVPPEPDAMKLHPSLLRHLLGWALGVAAAGVGELRGGGLPHRRARGRRADRRPPGERGLAAAGAARRRVRAGALAGRQRAGCAHRTASATTTSAR